MKVIWFGLLIFLAVASSSCGAATIHWKDLKFLRTKTELIRSGDHRALEVWLAKRGPKNYVEAFAKAMSHFKLKEFRSAAIFFAQSFFVSKGKPSKYFPGVVYNYLNSWKNMFRSKSPLHQEALYYTALSYFELGESKYTINFLDILEDYIDKSNQEWFIRYLELKARAYAKISESRAVHIYRKMLNIARNPTYYIRLGSIFEKKKAYKKALKYYLDALKSDKNQWSFKLASKEAAQILSERNSLKKYLNTQEKILLAEGYYLLKKQRNANSLWKEIRVSSLKKGDMFFYLKYRSRYLIRKRQYNKVEELFKRYSLKLTSDERKEVLLYVTQLYLRRNAYQRILNITDSGSSNHIILLRRLKALYKTKGNSGRREAGRYLKESDPDSTIAERTFFFYCFDKDLSPTNKAKENCLRELASVTENFPTGGRARYFLAKLLEERGDVSKARKVYKEIYLKSPSSYFAFRALEKLKDTRNRKLPSGNLEKIREWLSGQALRRDQLIRYFRQKKKSSDYGVDPFWKDLSSKLKSLDDESEDIKKAILLIGINQAGAASAYLNNKNEFERLLIYQKAGLLMNDAHLRYTYLKRYLIKKKKNIDIFTLSKEAMDSLYPTPYRKYINEASRKFGVESARLYALMKQESSFHPTVKSSAGATGLMQVMPSTGRWLNKKLKIRGMNLKSPRHSILLGAKFYSDVARKVNNDFEDIAISYNAGPGRLRNWKKKYNHQDKDTFLEQIPFIETSIYVKRTRSYYDRYKMALVYRF